MTETAQLLKAYVEEQSETAFRELIDRYLNLVYSAAMRLLNDDAHAAQDVAQTVFTELSRKAKTLPRDVQLGGWLYRTTCFAVSNLRRGEQRRIAREQQAVEMNMLHDDSDGSWDKLSPLLDGALNQLSTDDRDAIVLRFFEQRDFRSVGDALGLSADAAQKRVSRAVDKLRSIFDQQGVTLSVALLTILLATRTTSAAPTSFAQGLASTILRSRPISAYFLARKVKWMVAATAAVVLTALVVVQTGLLQSKREAAGAQQINPTAGSQPTATNLSFANAGDSNDNTNASDVIGKTSKGTNALHLVLVSAITGKPVAKGSIYCVRESEDSTDDTLSSDENGICDVDLPNDLKSLELTTEIEGFADTRLSWNVSRGEEIPKQYILRLTPPVKIGGRVEDESGRPMRDAQIRFDCADDVSSDKYPESHKFRGLKTIADSNGHWEINRIAPEMIRFVTGTAYLTNYLYSSVDVLREPEAEQQLIELKYVFRLVRGMTVTGTVVDPEGKPVAGATVSLGGYHGGPGGPQRRVTSEGDGSFRFDHCSRVADKIPRGSWQDIDLHTILDFPEFKELLTAEAEGFAPTAIAFRSEEKAMPLRIQLTYPKTLRIRVVGPDEKPIADASVSLETDYRSRSHDGKLFDGLRTPPPQIQFNQNTDSDGRLVWERAPAGEFLVNVSANGFVSTNELALHAGDDEHVITLHRPDSNSVPLSIAGTVQDENSKPIPRFRVLLGYADSAEEAGRVQWSEMGPPDVFVGGTYSIGKHGDGLYTEGVPGYVLKFEADGYAPFVSRVVKPDEGEATLDVVMRPSFTLLVSTVLPNGNPAVGADVGLISDNSKLKLLPGALTRDRNYGGSMLRTDGEGIFKWHPEDDVRRIIVVHSDGFGAATPEQLKANQVIQLQPWGRLEGVYMSGGKPAVGRELLVDFQNETDGTFCYDRDHCVKTDANGRFVFEKLPPGKCTVTRLVVERDGRTTSYPWDRPKLADVEIASGQTMEVRIGEGNTVTMRPRLTGVAAPGKSQMHAAIWNPPVPAHVEKNIEAVRAWLKTPEGQAFDSTSHSYSMEHQADGSWFAEGLPAGACQINVVLWDLRSNEEMPVPVANAIVDVNIPDDPNGQTIDAGIIEVKPLEQLRAQK